MVGYRQADPRYPFLWSDASQPAGEGGMGQVGGRPRPVGALPARGLVEEALDAAHEQVLPPLVEK